MKIMFALAMAGAILGGLWQQANGQTPDSPSSSSTSAKGESPFACNRMALSPEQRKRHFEELGPMLRGMRSGVRELPDGYEFKFPADMKTYGLVAEWAAGERVCCPFFDIELRAEREGGPLWLRLTGRPGVKEFIKVDAASWVKP